MRLVVTRPAEDAAPLAARLKSLGHEVLLEPLLEIEVQPQQLLLEDVQAVLFTSANGVRAFSVCREQEKSPIDLPAFCVGAATAEAARQAGFGQVQIASGDSASLAALTASTLQPEAGRLFHGAGEALAGDLAGDLSDRGFEVTRQTLYRAKAAPKLSAKFVDWWQSGGEPTSSTDQKGVLVYSPRTARTLVSLVEDAGLAPETKSVGLFALSPAVARAASALQWGALYVAETPREEALLALLPATQ